MDQQVKKKWYKRWWVIILFGVIAVVFISSIGGEPTASTPSNIVRVGEEGYLRVSGEIVTVARTKEAYDDFTQSMYAKDTYGMAKLVADGKAFNVPVGTKVLVIDQAVGDRKVRILEGSHTNEDGWVVKEFISKQ